MPAMKSPVLEFLSGKAPVLTLQGDSRKTLKTIPDESVDCCVTSPPYWGLRSYSACGCIKIRPRETSGIARVPRGGHDPDQIEPTTGIHAKPEPNPDCPHCDGTGRIASVARYEIGQEKTPEQYVANLVRIFREVWRTLKPHGTLWLNLGDSYVSTAPGTMGAPLRQQGILKAVRDITGNARKRMRPQVPPGSKPKDLVGIPWLVAFALRADGWYLRQWIPWVKRNSMPESVDDRPASSCEIVFLLSKQPDYFYDHEAVKLPASMSFVNDRRWQTGSTPANAKNGYEESKAQNPKSPHRMFDKAHGSTITGSPHGRHAIGDQLPLKDRRSDKQRGHSRKRAGFNDRWDKMEKEQQCSGWRTTRNSDWFFEGLLSNEIGDPLALVVSPAAYAGAHFATFPPGLIQPMIMAGTSARGNCPRCGAPWIRQVEKKRSFHSGSGKAGNLPEGKNGPAMQGGGATLDVRRGPIVESKTVGWTATCQCFGHFVSHRETRDDGSIHLWKEYAPDGPQPTLLPAIVLDPFGGSGTTGQMSIELGRRAIICELNPAYLPLIAERTNTTMGLPL